MAFTVSAVQRWLLPFLPGLVCLPIWAFLMTEKGVWMEAFSTYYPMSLAMILGCFIAGSTPLGGAIVAFPVAVLVLKLTPVQGRDFGALIQSVGMVAAAYMIFMKKRHLVNVYLIVTSCIASTFGVILGFCIDLPGFWVNIVYMTYTAAFAGVLFYKHAASSAPSEAKAPVEVCKENEQRNDAFEENDQNLPPATDKIVVAEKEKDTKITAEEDEVIDMKLVLVTGGLVLSLIVGGMLSAKLASGADTMAYIYGIFVYNSAFPNKAISESSLTASSIVIMAYTTVVIAIVRLVQGDISRESFLCWGAVLWIVVFGAPVGSLVLTKSRETIFRRLFYALAVGQFATFAVLKVKGNLQAWAVICSIMVGTGLCVALHAFSRCRSSAKLTSCDVAV